jgi:cell division protein FtsI/penicillin-binding protein 2
VSPPASERGGHARPRGLFAPRPRHTGSDAATGPPVGAPVPADAPAPFGAPVPDGAPGPNDGSLGPNDGHLGPNDSGPGPSSAAPGASGGPPGLNVAAPGPDTTVREPPARPPAPDGGPPAPYGGVPAPDGSAPAPYGGAPGPDGGPPWPRVGVSAPGTHPLLPDNLVPGPAAENGVTPSIPSASSDPFAPPAHSAPSAPGTRRPRGTRAARPAPGGSRPARHVAPSSDRPGRKASPAVRRAKRSRIAAVAIVAIGVLVIGLATGFGSELSAEPTAQSFLLAWQQQQYAAAGALTTAPANTVAASLRGAAAQLDAPQLYLSMKSVVQHGSTANASFMATVDLAQQGRVWTYQGHFSLRRVGRAWKVVWAPSVINPNLGPGERLAVLTTFPDRAAVLDAKGNPLQVKATAYVLGVVPDRLASPAKTAQAFARPTKLQVGQVLGLITAAPPHSFLRLATLDPPTYARLLPSLRKVPGLQARPESQRLFQSKATAVVGAVGSEINQQLRTDGALYAPGTTVGLSGLERKYQRELLGTPTTEVVAMNSAGQQTAVLAGWPGSAGTPVRTTIDSRVQDAALTALDGMPNSGEIVAVRASTGEVLAVAQHQASGSLPPDGALNAKLAPGAAFTIVSAAALVEKKNVSLSTSIPCASSFNVGGQTFASDGTGEQRPFRTAFAEGCGTAFAQLSERLTATEWTQVIREFGIGADWSGLQVPAFSGSVPKAAGQASLAAQTIGQGNVRMSLLSMAMVAATVDAGRWHVPQVLQAPDPPDPGATLDMGVMDTVRGLMRGAVRSGAAQAASQPGPQVYGQVGLVRTGSGWTSWFVGYRNDIAIAAIETGKTPELSAAALAGAFFAAAR